MRILLDECVPRPLKQELLGHVVKTVTEMGWSGKKNGELLRLIQAEFFDVFITVDQNVSFQQNLRNLSSALIVPVAATNKLDDLLPLMPTVRSRLAMLQPGEIITIG